MLIFYYVFQINLSWYGTPCNIHMVEIILKYDYSHGFKKFKTYSICPKYAIIKFPKSD